MNWNLGASHLPEVLLEGMVGKERGRPKGANSVASSFLPSFRNSFSGPHAAFCHHGQRPKTVDAAIHCASPRMIGNMPFHNSTHQRLPKLSSIVFHQIAHRLLGFVKIRKSFTISCPYPVCFVIILRRFMY
jgi:hypothetical protein